MANFPLPQITGDFTQFQLPVPIVLRDHPWVFSGARRPRYNQVVYYFALLQHLVDGSVHFPVHVYRMTLQGRWVYPMEESTERVTRLFLFPIPP